MYVAIYVIQFLMLKCSTTVKNKHKQTQAYKLKYSLREWDSTQEKSISLSPSKCYHVMLLRDQTHLHISTCHFLLVSFLIVKKLAKTISKLINGLVHAAIHLQGVEGIKERESPSHPPSPSNFTMLRLRGRRGVGVSKSIASQTGDPLAP